jgi:putative DNA primase/helicase
MTESTAEGQRWRGRVEETFNKLRWADRDAQELACKSIQEEFGSEEAGRKLRELFEIEHAKVRRLVDKAGAAVAKLPEPKRESGFADRMRSAVKAEAEASLKKPEVQPSVEKPKTEAAKAKVLTVGDLLRLPPKQRTLANLVALRVVEQRKPEPEPEPEIEEEPEAKPEVEEEFDEESRVLDRAAPLDNARKLIGFRYWHKPAMMVRLKFWQGEFWEWEGKHWGVIDNNTMRSGVYGFLDQAEQQIRGYSIRFLPTDTDVNKTMDALKAEANLLPENRMPGWLLGQAPVENLRELVAVQNGLLHVPTRKLLEHTPKFWSPNLLEFGYDPKAKAPRFEQFLDEIFPGDSEAQGALLEMIGLCMTDETKYQKAFMFVGPRRGGRGTSGRLLRGLVGQENYVGASLRGMAKQFGMQSWIGKKVVLFPDVRTDGIRSDVLSVIAENFLSVTGEDAIDIPRKWLTVWSGQLTARLVLFSNELARLQDDSGALPGRFITWRMQQSFKGREDPNLTDKLLAERPGMLNLALEALDRLRARGHFAQPGSGAEMSENLEFLASAVASFVNECCEVGPEHQVLLGKAYVAWGRWCTMKGVRYAWMENHFSEKLKAAVPTVTTARTRKDNPNRLTMLFGIRIRPGSG